MGKKNTKDISKAFFPGPEDNEFGDMDGYDYDLDDMDDNMDAGGRMIDEVEDDLEIIDIDDMDDDNDSEETEEEDDDESFHEENMFDRDYEDRDLDEEHSEMRRDIWSNIDWDKD